MKMKRYFGNYNVGDRVELLGMGNDPDSILPGTKGTVTSFTEFDDWAQVGVNWDNGRKLMVCLPEDCITRIKETK